MHRSCDVVTFDCYGTLIDWEGGIAAAFERAAVAAGRDVDREAVLAAYAEIEPEVEAGAFRPYREILGETARRVADRFGWTLGAGESAFLAKSLGDWPPFSDTVPALRRLAAAGVRLGILSNVDRDLLAETLGHLPVPFEMLVTAQDVRSYKPAHGHFVEARRSVGDLRWLHAAQSWFHDVVPATELAIPVAWINRKAEQPGDRGSPRLVLPDLAALVDAIVTR